MPLRLAFSGATSGDVAVWDLSGEPAGARRMRCAGESVVAEHSLAEIAEAQSLCTTRRQWHAHAVQPNSVV